MDFIDYQFNSTCSNCEHDFEYHTFLGCRIDPCWCGIDPDDFYTLDGTVWFYWDIYDYGHGPFDTITEANTDRNDYYEWLGDQ